MADQDTSFQAMDGILRRTVNIIAADPAVDTVNGFTSGGRQHRPHVRLAEAAGRSARSASTRSSRACVPSWRRIPGAVIFLQAAQDLRVGGRNSAALYQFTMRGDNLDDLIAYAPRMYQELRAIPIIADVNSDQQNRGLQSLVHLRPRHGRRASASRRS